MTRSMTWRRFVDENIRKKRDPDRGTIGKRGNDKRAIQSEKGVQKFARNNGGHNVEEEFFKYAQEVLGSDIGSNSFL